FRGISIVRRAVAPRLSGLGPRSFRLRPERASAPRLNTNALAQRVLGGRRLAIATKTPWYSFSEDGTAVRGSGGVVTALSSLRVRLSWTATAATARDRQLAAQRIVTEIRDTGTNTDVNVRFAHIDDDVFNRAMSHFVNPRVWFAQHGLLHRLQGEDRS